MKRSTISVVFSTLIVSAALIIAAWTGNPWACVAPGALFIFVAFPKWRGRMYRLADKGVGAIGRVFKRDRCNPE